MALRFLCPCGHQFEVPEEKAGTLVRCPECGYERTAPRPEQDHEVVFISGEETPRIGPEETSGLATLSLVLGVLFCFACFTGAPAIFVGLQALAEIRASGGRLRGRGRAQAGIALGVVGCLFAVVLILPAYESREPPRRAQCVNNLKQIGLAIHHYHQVHGCFPPAAIADRDNWPLLSWRVAILPFLEAGDLYAKFHLDEPWDSPNNRALVAAMPSIYACPSDLEHKPGTTGYQVVVGPGTIFPPDFTRVTFADVTDGTEQTLLVGESTQWVPWSKPDDLQLDSPLPSFGLSSHHNKGYNALMADGSVRFLKHSVAPNILRALLTRSGHESISYDDY